MQACLTYTDKAPETGVKMLDFTAKNVPMVSICFNAFGILTSEQLALVLEKTDEPEKHWGSLGVFGFSNNN